MSVTLFGPPLLLLVPPTTFHLAAGDSNEMEVRGGVATVNCRGPKRLTLPEVCSQQTSKD